MWLAAWVRVGSHDFHLRIAVAAIELLGSERVYDGTRSKVS